MYNQDFIEKLAHEELEWSEEDRFMDRMSKELKIVGGHIQLPLPLRDNAIYFLTTVPWRSVDYCTLRNEWSKI